MKELLFDKWRMKDQKGEPVFPTVLDKVRAIFYPPGESFHKFRNNEHLLNIEQTNNKLFHSTDFFTSFREQLLKFAHQFFVRVKYVH